MEFISIRYEALLFYNCSAINQMPTIPKCLKEDDEETEIWNQQQSAEQLLNKFQDFARRVNGACDAEENSYDGMVLLTGRGDTLSEAGPGWINK